MMHAHSAPRVLSIEWMRLFTSTSSLLFHQGVQVCADTFHIVVARAVDIPPPSDKAAFDFSLSDEEVEQTTLHAIGMLNVAPAPPFHLRNAGGVRHSRCQRDFVFDHADTINATLLPGHQSQLGE